MELSNIFVLVTAIDTGIKWKQVLKQQSRDVEKNITGSSAPNSSYTLQPMSTLCRDEQGEPKGKYSKVDGTRLYQWTGR